jgi:SAM-dependent methyltransferase
MKIRESGMPEQAYWESLFDVPAILDAFGFNLNPNRQSNPGDIVEVGCGYGTFALPLAQRIHGTFHALDVDSTMVRTTARRATEAGIKNLHTSVRDVLSDGFGLPPGSCAAALLFNILHAEAPLALLRGARDIIQPGGWLTVIHWRSDVPTPRGPPLSIRPTPVQVLDWAEQTGGLIPPATPLDLPPWHYGLKFIRSA